LKILNSDVVDFPAVTGFTKNIPSVFVKNCSLGRAAGQVPTVIEALVNWTAKAN